MNESDRNRSNEAGDVDYSDEAVRYRSGVVGKVLRQAAKFEVATQPGITQSEIARRYGVHPDVVRAWFRDVEEYGLLRELEPQPSDYEQLERIKRNMMDYMEAASAELTTFVHEASDAIRSGENPEPAVRAMEATLEFLARSMGIVRPDQLAQDPTRPVESTLRLVPPDDGV